MKSCMRYHTRRNGLNMTHALGITIYTHRGTTSGTSTPNDNYTHSSANYTLGHLSIRKKYPLGQLLLTISTTYDNCQSRTIYEVVQLLQYYYQLPRVM